MNRSWCFIAKLAVLLLIVLSLPMLCSGLYSWMLYLLDGFEQTVYEMFSLPLPLPPI